MIWIPTVVLHRGDIVVQTFICGWLSKGFRKHQCDRIVVLDEVLNSIIKHSKSQ